MAELHQRDLRNSATPIHAPVVQHIDYKAAEDEGRLDETTALTGEGIEGDADFAVSVAESVEEQIADRDERLRSSKEEPEQPLVDNTSPEGEDGQSPLNAFGNVAPEHAIESDADRNANVAPQLAPANGGDPTNVPAPVSEDRKADSELATASDTKAKSKDSDDEPEADTHQEHVEDRSGAHPVEVADEPDSSDEDDE